MVMKMSNYGEARMMARVGWEGKTMLHLQGVGEQDSRPYGMSIDIRVNPDVIEWLNTQQATMPSANQMVDGDGNPTMLNPSNQYVACDVQSDGERVAILIRGESINHADGALVELKGSAPSVEFTVNFADANGILVDTVDTHTGDESNDDSSLSAGEEE